MKVTVTLKFEKQESGKVQFYSFEQMDIWEPKLQERFCVNPPKAFKLGSKGFFRTDWLDLSRGQVCDHEDRQNRLFIGKLLKS